MDQICPSTKMGWRTRCMSTRSTPEWLAAKMRWGVFQNEYARAYCLRPTPDHAGGVPHARRAERAQAHTGGHRAPAQGLCRPTLPYGAHSQLLGLGCRAAARLPRRRISPAMTDLTKLGIAKAGRLMA